MGGQATGQRDTDIEKQTDRQRDTDIERQTDRQRDRETERQRDRETERQRDDDMNQINPRLESDHHAGQCYLGSASLEAQLSIWNQLSGEVFCLLLMESFRTSSTSTGFGFLWPIKRRCDSFPCASARKSPSRDQKRGSLRKGSFHWKNL